MRLIAALLCIASFGCATVGQGPYQQVAVDSVPDRVEVTLENCGRRAPETLITPAVVSVSRRSTACRLTFAPGTSSAQTVQLRRQLSDAGYLYSLGQWCGNGARHCNSLDDVYVTTALGMLAFFPSIIIDAATGALFEQTPDAVFVEIDE